MLSSWWCYWFWWVIVLGLLARGPLFAEKGLVFWLGFPYWFWLDLSRNCLAWVSWCLCVVFSLPKRAEIWACVHSLFGKWLQKATMRKYRKEDRSGEKPVKGVLLSWWTPRKTDIHPVGYAVKSWIICISADPLRHEKLWLEGWPLSPWTPHEWGEWAPLDLEKLPRLNHGETRWRLGLGLYLCERDYPPSPLLGWSM